MIPSGVIEDIRYRNDIEDVVSSYVPLKRAGSNNLKGLCPFHSERTPSFTVYKDTQSFYCFGCGAGGDVINFIMRQENLDYISAAEFLAKRAGIDLPDYNERSPQKEGPSRTRILQMNMEAAKYFRQVLFDDVAGAPGREYLIKKRQLSSSIVKHFGLGYSPPSWNETRQHLSSLGFTPEEMTAGFLCGKGEHGYYDYFRGRVMFPIIDVSGNIIAFGGRVLDDSTPKYLNTSDTPAFKKSRNLFALNFAKNSKSDTMIICEGYMDVIALHAAGFTNAVATLGTAITSEHARILKRYVSKAVLSYDSDDAGHKATDRAIGILAEVGIDAKILVMDGAKDPDEYIKKYGREAFARLIDSSRSKFSYIIEKTLKKYDIRNPDEKIKAADELCREIASVNSGVERDIYIKRVSSELEIDPKSISLDVESAIRKRKKADQRKQSGELLRQTSGISDRVNPDFARRPKSARLEENLLGMLMFHPEYISIEYEGAPVSEDDFFTSLGKRIFSHIKEKSEKDGFTIGSLSGAFSLDEVSRTMKMMNDRRELTNDVESYLSYLGEIRKENARHGEETTLEKIINSKRGELGT